MSLLLLAAIVAATAELPRDPGMYEAVFERADGSVLRYTISLPRGYNKDEPRTLVLALHYAGEVTPYYGKGLLEQLVEPGLRHLGAILVAPDCLSRGWGRSSSTSSKTTPSTENASL
jgi:hypothetical protein